MAVRNTSADDPLINLMSTLGEGGIERQEKLGQTQLAKSSQLPTEGLASIAAEHGITVKGETKGDPMFSDVELPEGWSIQPTDHSMWSNLVDDNGMVIAGIFYKAAFYDRRAFISRS